MSASDTTDSSHNDGSSTTFKRAAPIPILESPHRRRPSNSSSSDGSPSSPAVQTPTSIYPNGIAPSSPTGSSLFSYLLSSSPKSASFPIAVRRPQGFVAPPVFEDDDGQEIEVRSTRDVHHRRATSGWSGNGRTPPSPTRASVAPPVIEAQHARGAGVLRRLSLGGGLGGTFFQNATNRPPSPPQPSTPPPSAVDPSVASGFPTNQNNTEVRSRIRRSATLSVPPAEARRRAPSPMGERILKGHFDGFN